MPPAILHLLSVPAIDRLKLREKDYMVNDGGGLYLYVRRYKTKEWIFRYTSPKTNKRRKQTLGSYPDTSLKDAREIASRKRAILSKGIDPADEAEAVRSARIQEQKEIQLKAANRVEQVFHRWIVEDFKNQKSKGKETKRMFLKDVLPLLGFKPIDEVTRQDVKDVLARPLARLANRTANIMLTDLKRFFNYAEDEELISKNPTRRLTKDRVGGRQKSRERVLSKEEIILLKEKLPLAELKQEYIHAIYLYLATGCRRNEIIRASVENFNLTERNYFIPSAKAKNSDAHNIYLSDFAIRQVAAITAITGNKWLLPDVYGDNPLDEGALQKQIRMRQPELPIKGFKEKWRPIPSRRHNNTLELLNGHWTTHDLRRTAATIMQELGIMPHIIKRCLNQRINDPIIETYQRAKLIEEQKQAFILLGNYLSNLIETDNVDNGFYTLTAYENNQLQILH